MATDGKPPFQNEFLYNLYSQHLEDIRCGMEKHQQINENLKTINEMEK